MADDKDARRLTESDLASERMGRNELQGDDQLNVRNERQAVPDVKQETDGVIESFEKLDKDKRAREDLGKGNRSQSSGQDDKEPAVRPDEDRNPGPDTSGEGGGTGKPREV